MDAVDNGTSTKRKKLPRWIREFDEAGISRYIVGGLLVPFVPLVIWGKSDLWETFKAYLMAVGAFMVAESILSVVVQKIKSRRG